MTALLWCEIATIGDASGLWRFCTIAPDDTGPWKPWIVGAPDILSQLVAWGGGAIRGEGSVVLELADIGGALTDLLELDSDPVAVLSGDAGTGSTVFNVASLPSVPNGTLMWVGSEVIRVDGTTSTPATLQVTRGLLGTSAVPQRRGQGLHLRPWWIRGRELRLWLQIDGVDYAVGVYAVDEVRLGESGSSFRIGATAREPYLDRRVARRPHRYEVAVIDEAYQVHGVLPLDVTDLTGETWIHIASGDEVLQYTPRPTGERMAYLRSVFGRGVSRTEQEDLPALGTVLERVLSVEQQDFRAVPVSSGIQARESSTRAHAVYSWPEILLCVLTSPAQLGETATNHQTGGVGWAARNFSLLPPGYGLGVPAELIDFASFEAVANSPANFDLRLLILRSGQTFSEWVEPILKAAGCFLTRDRGVIRLVYPEPLLPGASAPRALTTADVLMASELPDVEANRAEGEVVSEVRLKVGPEEREIVVAASDVPRLLDPQDLFEVEGQSLDLELPGADGYDQGTWYALALRKLRRSWRPSTVLDMRLRGRADIVSWPVGEAAQVSLPVIPGWRGGRGISGLALLERIEPIVEPSRALEMSARVRFMPGSRVGLVSASGLVASVSGAAATLDSDYTGTGGPSTLAERDADAFALGDAVRLVDRSGAELAAGETVLGIAGDVVTLSGDFGGALAPDTVLVFELEPSLNAAQSASYVWQADLPVWEWS